MLCPLDTERLCYHRYLPPKSFFELMPIRCHHSRPAPRDLRATKLRWLCCLENSNGIFSIFHCQLSLELILVHLRSHPLWGFFGVLTMRLKDCFRRSYRPFRPPPAIPLLPVAKTPVHLRTSSFVSNDLLLDHRARRKLQQSLRHSKHNIHLPCMIDTLVLCPWIFDMSEIRLDSLCAVCFWNFQCCLYRTKTKKTFVWSHH
mmetsp:Transcript_22477/g.55721  ORF Transcript_22477/g.55721 Transcript_22477/m.55721 type:complete len:202 (+) Transcript_22477:583-1188(+)